MWKYSTESVCVYINIFRHAAAGGVHSKTLVCIVCVSAPLAPCRVITWGNLLPNQHWHTEQQSTPPPHLSSPPFLSLSSGASQLILHHFIFSLLRRWQMADCYFSASIHAFWHRNQLSAIISQSRPNTKKKQSACCGVFQQKNIETYKKCNNVKSSKMTVTKKISCAVNIITTTLCIHCSNICCCFTALTNVCQAFISSFHTNTIVQSLMHINHTGHWKCGELQHFAIS